MTVAELTKRIPLEPIVSCITHPPFCAINPCTQIYVTIYVIADHEEGPWAETILYKNILLC